MEQTDKLTPGARSLVDTIHRLASEIMCKRYDQLNMGMKMRLGSVIKESRKMLEENPVVTK